MHTKNDPISIKGTRALILFGIDGTVFLRIGDGKGYVTFKDYALRHPDIEVMILDEDAFLYEFHDGGGYIDCSPQTLGYENEK